MKNLYNKCLFYRYRDISITICSIVILFFLIIIFCVLFFVKFNFSYRYNGLVLKEGDDFYVSVLVSDNELKKLQNYTFIVDKKKNDYQIVNISSDYVLSDNGVKREIFLKFDISDDKKIINNIVELTFLDNETFFGKLKERFK